MDGISLKVLVAASITIWLLLCLYLYTFFRQAAWLAGSAVVSCLFFLGATVAISLLVKGAFYLAPLWLGILVLCAIHLYKARHATMWTKPSYGQTGSGAVGQSSAQQSSPSFYI